LFHPLFQWRGFIFGNMTGDGNQIQIGRNIDGGTACEVGLQLFP
jgi:hypothetical protein